jgi:hypothetical protein
MNPFLTLLGVVIALQTGCAGKPPPPYEFERWEKVGASKVEIMKALLECGFLSPDYGDLVIYTKDRLSTNDYALAQRCMRKNGFKQIEETGFFANPPYDPCSHSGKCPPEKELGLFEKSIWKPCPDPERYYPACDLPEDQIPGRSVEKRLNSQYCKSYYERRECQ